jgi:hypothetical protein
MITQQKQLKGRYVYAGKIPARLAIHLKLDQMVRNSVRTYVTDHWGDMRYWDKQCQPYLNLLSEHHRLAQVSTRSLKHYQKHVEKLAKNCPHRPPNTKRAKTLLALVETWYWREYP